MVSQSGREPHANGWLFAALLLAVLLGACQGDEENGNSTQAGPNGDRFSYLGVVYAPQCTTQGCDPDISAVWWPPEAPSGEVIGIDFLKDMVPLPDGYTFDTWVNITLWGPPMWGAYTVNGIAGGNGNARVSINDQTLNCDPLTISTFYTGGTVTLLESASGWDEVVGTYSATGNNNAACPDISGIFTIRLQAGQL